jgi:hypothetical protein
VAYFKPYFNPVLERLWKVFKFSFKIVQPAFEPYMSRIQNVPFNAGPPRRLAATGASGVPGNELVTTQTIAV